MPGCCPAKVKTISKRRNNSWRRCRSCGAVTANVDGFCDDICRAARIEDVPVERLCGSKQYEHKPAVARRQLAEEAAKYAAGLNE